MKKHSKIHVPAVAGAININLISVLENLVVGIGQFFLGIFGSRTNQ